MRSAAPVPLITALTAHSLNAMSITLNHSCPVSCRPDASPLSGLTAVSVHVPATTSVAVSDYRQGRAANNCTTCFSGSVLKHDSRKWNHTPHLSPLRSLRGRNKNSLDLSSGRRPTSKSEAFSFLPQGLGSYRGEQKLTFPKRGAVIGGATRHTTSVAVSDHKHSAQATGCALNCSLQSFLKLQ